MHILVTGGCGYIGTVLTTKLLALGYQVTVFDIQWFGNFHHVHKSLTIIKGDIRDIESVPMQGVDVVIHLANVANDPCGELNAKLAWEVNALATMYLMERAIAYGVQQFIYASSGSVYGVKQEEQVTEDLPLVPITDYNKTKMISERVLMSYQDKIILQIIRPATVCGYSPRMRLDVSVNILTIQALENKKMTVFGGEQTRPNIHIQDITNVFIHFLQKGDKHVGIFNAGFENISILDIAKRIQEKIAAEIVVTESNDPRSYRQNSDKLLNTGFVPKYCISDAVQEIINSYESGQLKNADCCYNIRTMKGFTDLNL